MGSFTIWHWLVVLILFAPAIIGIAVMGIQRSILLRHEASGLTKKGYYGYSWTYLFLAGLCQSSGAKSALVSCISCLAS